MAEGGLCVGECHQSRSHIHLHALELKQSTQLEGNRKSKTLNYDLNSLLKRCGGNENLANKMLTAFQREVDRHIESLTQSASDEAKLAKTAHAIKGAAAMVSANSIAEKASELEASTKLIRVDSEYTLQLIGEVEELLEQWRRIPNDLSNPSETPQLNGASTPLTNTTTNEVDTEKQTH